MIFFLLIFQVYKQCFFFQSFLAQNFFSELTKDKYFDFYQLALSILKTVDQLDPDKIKSQRKNSEVRKKLIKKINKILV